MDSFNSSHPEDRLTLEIGAAFYRPQMRPIRDLGLLAAIVYRQKQGHLRVLETMSGSGIRSVRYGLEAGADWIWCNDANPDLQATLGANLQRYLPSHSYQVTSLNAQDIFARCTLDHDRYDLVDIDGFGTAFRQLPSLWSALAPGGLLYWTATDGQVLGGHDPDRCLQRYGAYARALPCTQEQAMRIVIGSLAAAARQHQCSIRPIFATYTGQTYRVLIQRLLRPEGTGGTWGDRYGFLGYCQRCGAYQTVDWRHLGRMLCPQDGHPMTLSGPLWLGPLHDPETLAAMEILALERSWLSLIPTLTWMQAEAHFPPYHFSLREVAKWSRGDPPNRDRFLAALREAGATTSRIHWNPEGFKTTAPWPTCLGVSRQCTSRHPL